MDSYANFLGPLSAFMASVTWAIGSPVYSRVAKTQSPATINATRALLTLPFFLLLILVMSGFSLEPFYTLNWANTSWLALGIFCTYAVGDALFMVASHSIGVSSALALTAIFPLWAALFGYFFLGQELGLVKNISLIVIILGVVLVIISGKKLAAPTHSVTKGVLMALTTSIMWAANSLATAKGTIGIDSFVICLVRMSFGFIFCTLSGAVLRRSFVKPVLSWKVLKPVLPLFLFESVGGAIFFVYGFKHAPVAVAAVLTSLAPVIAMPIALWHKTDHITPSKALGIVLVVLGVAVLVG